MTFKVGNHYKIKTWAQMEEDVNNIVDLDGDILVSVPQAPPTAFTKEMEHEAIESNRVIVCRGLDEQTPLKCAGSFISFEGSGLVLLEFVLGMIDYCLEDVAERILEEAFK